MSCSTKKALPVYLVRVLAVVLSLQGINTKVLAQSITATPDGTGTIINHNGNTYHITGGTQAGANLFHSFVEFGLNPQEVANFLSNPSINNVLGRVTGGNPSIIQGLIQLSGGNSNLFLMNPAGWVFSSGASLDVPGSFGVTTATRMGFGDGYFNALGDNTYSNLTGNPTSLIFDQTNPSWIVNEGNLAVKPGESLWAVGGGIISTGTVKAEGGEITLAAVPGESKVKLSHEGMVLNLILEAAPVEGNVVLPNTAVGIQSVDIPRYLTGGSNIGHANQVIFDENGDVRLVNGDNVIAGEVTAEEVTLMAAEKVIPTDRDLVSNDPVVVLFPEEIGTPVETTFIDEGVEDYQSFLYGGKKGTISRVVTHQENGISTVTETLTEIGNQGGEVSAIHLLTEGNEGEFWLGRDYISAENIGEYEQQLQAWAITLTSEADLLLYSCFTALGYQGEELVNALATFTGADVAASTNLTGSEALGGDWVFETQTGAIEAGLGFEEQVLVDFAGKLQVFSVGDAADLIAAINTANGNAEADTINLTGDVTLTAVDNMVDGPNGLPSITASDKLTINGMGNTIARDTSMYTPNFRILHIALGAELEVNEATLSGGKADTGSLIILLPADSGGAIFNRGTLTVNDSTISGNEALNDGGGIYSTASMTNAATVNINRSTISGNSAGDNGGGLANSVFVGGGGPLPNASTMTITDSTISGNSANDGGGVSNFGQNGDNGSVMTITNSTISGNTANFTGGGVYNRGQSALFGSTITITNSTVVQNEVTNVNGLGGGIFNTGFFAVNSGRVIVENSIIAQNVASTDTDVKQAAPVANAPVIDQGNNLIGVDDQGLFTTSTLVGSIATPLDPKLAPLGDYGGPTQTHALLPDSPAINTGNDNLAVDQNMVAFTTDQRGAARFKGTVDIGAFEFQGIDLSVTAGDNQSTTVDTNFATNLQVQVVETFANKAVPVSGLTVTFTPNTGSTGANATFLAATTITTDASGNATASTLKANTVAGVHTVTASSTGLTSLDFNLTNSPDVTSQFIVTGFPEPITAGNSGKFTVTAQDKFGNITPDYTGTVNFSSTDPLATLPSASNLTDGVGSFSATLNTAGEQTLTATDGSITGNQTNITIDPSNPDFTPVWQSVQEELTDSEIGNSACQTAPSVMINSTEEKEEITPNKEIETAIQRNQDCQPVTNE